MTFLYPSLISIGLSLALVPLIIHLINPRRQRTIRWAAMQFLQESQRRNRTWILLRQLLLLATRMIAIALLALLLAGTALQSSWARLFGTSETNHVVLLDDSFSMSDRGDNADAVERAKLVVTNIAAQALRQSDSARLTLLSFSEASRLSAAEEPKLYRSPINDEFLSRLPSLLAKREAGEAAVGPAEGLLGVGRLPQPVAKQTRILHVLSDFRTRHFRQSTEVREQLSELTDQFDQIHLVQCVRTQRPNLAITSLRADGGLPAAGVETWMSLAVKNYGRKVVRDVTVRLEQDGAALPALVLKEIPAGEESAHRFRIRFEGVGSHWLTASIDEDAVEADNRRHFTCHLAASVPVLLVDDSTDGRDAYYLSKALDPGGPTHTGWQPQIERPEFLRTASGLGQFAAICLLDVSRLDEAAVSALEEYVDNGGGVAFFLGTNVQRTFYNEQLYRDGAGIFPVLLKLPRQMLRASGETSADVILTEHPLFQVFLGERNSFLSLLQFNYYYAAAADWDPDQGIGARVLARVRDRSPLIVEQRRGTGRVLAHLFKLSPQKSELGEWTNWSVNPVFPVLANELMRYLSAGRAGAEDHLVGETLAIDLAADQYQGDLRLRLPSAGPLRMEMPVEARQQDDIWQVRLDDVTSSGIYELRMADVGGAEQRRSLAVNVDPREGDLALLDRADVADYLQGVRYEFHYADELQIVDEQVAGSNLSGTLLGILLVALIGEQLLGYLASYHTMETKVKRS